jgi:O-acetyl-ADP-ribose deacetylase (regulator of RNase III)
MITYTTGNLLEAPADALVNTVNTVGVMGKGIALMFKERFPQNMDAYAKACKVGAVKTGKMFITEPQELVGPRWIVNFPTKQHWKANSKIEWIEEGLIELRHFLIKNKVRSIAIPPLGAGNGGLNWADVKPKIEAALGDLNDVNILIYEPSVEYQNVAKSMGVQKLTPARAMISELIRRYWALGMDCSLLEIQKLAWFLQRFIEKNELENGLKLNFEAKNYGPYAYNLNHLLNSLDGSYLTSEKRIPDCKPLDVIWFKQEKVENISIYLKTDAKEYLPVLNQASDLIDGFESPFGLELLATVDWILHEMDSEPTVESVRRHISEWPAGKKWADRKLSLFDDNSINFALERLQSSQLSS